MTNSLSTIVIFLLLSTIAALVIGLHRRDKRVHEENLKFLMSSLKKHGPTLVTRYIQTVSKDHYGNQIFKGWISERDYFIDNVLKTERPSIFWTAHRGLVVKTIDETVIEMRYNLQSSAIDVDSLDPIEFEHHCATLLDEAGWSTRVTKASGDQGVDIVADRRGVRAVFQCKKYSRPVGNDAVQQIIAGRVFERASIGAVVSNTSFTLAAKQLASTANIHLLHFSELANFSEK